MLNICHFERGNYPLERSGNPMHRVIRVKPLPAYRLFVEFADGVKGEVDLASEDEERNLERT